MKSHIGTLFDKSSAILPSRPLLKLSALSLALLPLMLIPHAEAKPRKSTPAATNKSSSEMTYLEELGKRLFFENISEPKRQSCSSCHYPPAGGTNQHSGVNLKQVAVTGADPNGDNNDTPPGVKNAGGLKPPTNKYVQHMDENGDVVGLKNFQINGCNSVLNTPRGPITLFFTCGGAFWNGRASGHEIEDSKANAFSFSENAKVSEFKRMYEKYLGPVADQAFASPFINHVEQGIGEGKPETRLEDIKLVCEQVAKSAWGNELYEYAWDEPLDCSDKNKLDTVFARFAIALSAWQLSSENNPYDSKRDKALLATESRTFPLNGLTELENEGHELFYGKAGCAAICHRSNQDVDTDGTLLHQRYTDDAFHNIGVPRNYELPGSPEPDEGLYGVTEDERDKGLHKTPTLRNVDLRPGNGFTKAYTHNGWFKNLETLVHFYNSADVNGATAKGFGITRCPEGVQTQAEALANNCWPASEFPDTSVIGVAIGNLGLTSDEEAAIVAYLKTLSDTSIVQSPKPYKSAPYDESRMEH